MPEAFWAISAGLFAEPTSKEIHKAISRANILSCARRSALGFYRFEIIAGFTA